MSLDSRDVGRLPSPADDTRTRSASTAAQLRPTAPLTPDGPTNLWPAPPDPARLARWRARHSATLLGTDTLVLVGLTYLTSLRYGLPGTAEFALLILWAAMIGLAGGYRMRRIQLGVKLRTALLSGAALLGATGVLGLLVEWEGARDHILLTIPAGMLGLVAVRLAWAGMLRRRLRTAPGLRRTLVLGEAHMVGHIRAELIRCAPSTGYSVIDVVTWGQSRTGSEGPQGPNAVAQARDAVLSSGADLVVLAGSDALDAASLRRLAWELADLNVELATSSGLSEIAGWRLRSESVGGLAMVHVDLPRLRGWAAAYKRVFDVVFSLLALMLIAPLMLLSAAVIKLDSPGPALFRQQRVGLDHSRFTMLKFRSMRTDAEEMRAQLLTDSEGNDVLFKMRRDPRVTRIGRLIRRCSIDELPQFLNVLRGEMSVVGPRPPLPAETEEYDDDADRRLTVKPGITGLWQVHGRSDLDWERSLRLDLYYVENWSPGTDLRIVLRTVWAVFSGAGAY